jgi:hypothetical protein
VTTKYEKAVAEARRLVTRSEEDQWRLAELTWQQIEVGAVKAKWERDTGIGLGNARRLFAIWQRWGQVARLDRPAFTDAVNMIAEGGETPDEARELKQDRQALGSVRKASPERKKEIARELLADEAVAQAVVEHPETMRNVNRAASRTTEGRDLTQRGKAHEARAEEHGPALTTPLAILPLFLEHATVLREAAERITVNGATDEALPMLAKLGEHLAATGRLFISAAEGATTKITDADLDAWLSGEAR